MREFVRPRASGIQFVGRAGMQEPIGADWPAHVALREPALGYVQMPREARLWRPGEPEQAFALLWVETWKHPDPTLQPPAESRVAEFGDRYRVVLYEANKGRFVE